MSLSAPDAVGELLGARAWRLVRGNLWSLYRPVVWRPDRPVRAECLTPEPPSFALVPPAAHDAPYKGCRCGLYAAFWPPQGQEEYPNTRSDLPAVLGLPKGASDEVVIGEVAGWGRTELYTRGFRCEWAVVRAIYDTHPSSGEVAEAYDVPLVSALTV